MKAKLSLLLNVILLAVVAFGVNRFVIQGKVATAEDGRTAVLLEPGERDYVLAEMRGFLETVQSITAAIGENDMAAASELAGTAAKFSPADVPAPLFAKLPIEFKTLGLETHKLFGSVAEAAQDTGTPQAVAASLGNLMVNCTSCHSAYKLGFEAPTN